MQIVLLAAAHPERPWEALVSQLLAQLATHAAPWGGAHVCRRLSALEDVSEVLVYYFLGVYETQSNPQATRVIA